MLRLILILVAASFCLFATSAASIEQLQSDDFQDGTTQGWRSGGANPNPPFLVESGGPEGAGDGFLQIEASGSPGAGGNLVAFNTEQWTGNYLADGVIAVRAHLRNLGPSDLVIRLLFEGEQGSFLSAAAARLPAGGDWQEVVWPAAALADETDPSIVLSQIAKLRILHAPTEDDLAPIEGVLGVDNIIGLTGGACLDEGLRRGELAVCRVYCERLDCDARARPRRACHALSRRFERRTGDLPPCEFDSDDDGWADDIDNCPVTPNADLSDRDGDGVGDVCDNCPDAANPDQTIDVCSCPCFTGADVASLIDTLRDPVTYEGLVCVDQRPNTKPLTFVRAVRIDGAPCGADSQDCSALAAEFTEDNACQLNPAAPASAVSRGEISERQREICRELILMEADRAALDCQ